MTQKTETKENNDSIGRKRINMKQENSKQIFTKIAIPKELVYKYPPHSIFRKREEKGLSSFSFSSDPTESDQGG